MSEPMIGVAPTKYIEGAKSPTESLEPLTIMPAAQAFMTAWRTDAHFVCYHTSNGKPYPRLRKLVLPLLRMEGIDVRTQIFAFDYDNPGHQPWNEANPETSKQVFVNRLTDIFQAWPFAANYSLLYSTTKGARFVYFLDTPIPVDQAEDRIRWMVSCFHSLGLAVDPLCDWTRLFRLPYVSRDGANTWETDPSMFFFPQWEARIQGMAIPCVEKGQDSGTQALDIQPFEERQPDNEYAKSLMREVSPESGQWRQTTFAKEAKRRLKGRECYTCLFENAKLAEQGSRNSTLHRYVSQAISLLYASGVTPAHIYALFLEPVSHLETDSGTPDWTVVLWDQIGRIWQVEDAKFRQTEQEKEVVAEQQLELIDQVAKGMREWCNHPDLRSSEPQVMHAFVSKHLIASHADTYYVMRPDGRYCKNPVSAPSLVPEIRRLGMDQIIQITKMNDEGGVREVDRGSIVRQHCTLVSRALILPQLPGGQIAHIGTDNAQLEIPSYRRNPNLVPEFDHEVDAWLKAMAGPYYAEICDWIAWGLAFEEGPICALSIEADPGIGKKLLTRGMEECLELPSMATGDDLTGAYQYGLIDSPFLVIDEGWGGGGGGKTAADEFRRLSAGSEIPINRKFMAPVKAYNPVRIMFMANDLSVVRHLVAGREMGPAGRRSIEDRLRHYKLGNKGALWLEARGGLLYTGAKGRRWVRGDGGEPSDFIVAKHFLYLHANRGPRRPGRLLVMGSVDREIMFEFRTADAPNQRVVECVLRMLNQKQPRAGICIQDCRLFVLSSDILDFYRLVLSKESGDKLSINAVTRALEHFTLHKWPNAFVLRDRPEVGKARWHELDPQLLHEAAVEHGWSCPKLTALIAELERMGVQNGLVGLDTSENPR